MNFKKILKEKAKRALALLLVFSMVLTMLPALMLPVAAETVEPNDQNGFFRVTTYDTSAKIELPFYDGESTQIYVSTANTYDVSTAKKVFDSLPYEIVVEAYANNLAADTTYYFYLGHNGYAPATPKVSAKTDAAAKYWTDEGNYDLDWYNNVKTNYASYNNLTDRHTGKPVVISTAAQFASLSKLVNEGNNFSEKLVQLIAPIDVSAYLWTPTGTESNPFAGTFDGANYYITQLQATSNTVISGLHTNDITKDYQGLFGYNSGTIKNVGVVKGYINGNINVAGIVGYNSGTLNNCYNTCTINGQSLNIGGVAGYSESSVILNCYNTGDILGNTYVGGMIGLNNGGTVTSSYNSGNVTTTGNYSGGIIGSSSQGSVSSCYNSGNINGINVVGGLAGALLEGASFDKCYSIGIVNGADKVGGVIGEIDDSSTCSNTYNSGNVTGTTTVGPVAGSSTTATNVKTSYNIGKVNGGSKYIYYDNNGSQITSDSTGLKNISTLIGFVPAVWCNSPTQYLTKGVFSTSNPVNKGYPVLMTFGYTGDDTSIMTQLPQYSRLVKNVYQLDLMRNYSSFGLKSSFFLAFNIDLSPAQYNKSRTKDGSWIPIGNSQGGFESSFGGEGYSISGMYINSSNNAGFFDNLNGNIQSVGFVDSVVNGGNSTGGIAASVAGSMINCYNTGTVRGYNTGTVSSTTNYNSGGLAGGSSKPMLFCYNAGTVFGGDNGSESKGNVGGIVGANSYSKSSSIGDESLKNCYNIGSVICTAGSFVGGIAGQGYYVKNCYNTGIVKLLSFSDCKVGGILGVVAGLYGATGNPTIIDCYNTGEIKGNIGVGGIAAEGYITTRCYNTGKVSGTSKVGGVTGHCTNGGSQSTMLKCYNTGAVSGRGQHVGGVTGFAANITNCYNTGAINNNLGTDENYTGGVAGRGIIFKNCYNTGSVSGYDYTGGVAGNAISTVSASYNTGTVKGTQCVGGIAGQGSTIRTCYSIGEISGTGTYVGGISGLSTIGNITNCFYIGYTRAWGGMTPFISYTSTLGEGRYTDIKEVELSELSVIRETFGITSIKYPDAYESSDTDIITLDGKIATSGVKAGKANLTGISGTGSNPNSQIVISQYKLLMTGDGTSYIEIEYGKSPEQMVVSANVSLPITVDSSTSGNLAITVTPNTSTNTALGQAMTFTSTLVGETLVSAKSIAFTLKDSSGNSTNLGAATTNSSGIATLTNPWTPTIAGEYTLTVTYIASDGLTKIGTKTITISKNLSTVSMNIAPASSSLYGDSVTITPVLNGVYGGILPSDFEYYIDGTKYTSATASYTFKPDSAKVCSIYVNYIGNNNNNLASSMTTSYDVGKATPTLTVTSSNTGNIYKGSEFTIGAGTLTGVSTMAIPTGTITYTYYINEPGTIETEISCGSATSGGAPVNAGTYYVKAFYPGDANYNAVQSSLATLVINQKTLTIEDLQATDRAYNSTTTVSLTGGTLSGIVGADNVTANIPTSGAIDKNVGDAKAVTLDAVLLSGIDAANYTLTIPNLTVNISQKLTNITVNIDGKMYDGNDNATVSSIDFFDYCQGDKVSFINGTFNFDSQNVGTDITVTASGYSLTGEDAENYILNSVTATTADITAKKLIVTPTILSKYYGQPDLAISYTYSGYIGGEIPAVTGAISRTEGENVGNYALSISNLILVDNQTFKASNYTLILDSSKANFTVTQYEPKDENEYDIVADATASGNDGWYTGEVILAAPTGYLISTTNTFDGSTWTNSIILDNQDNDLKSSTYFLKEEATGAITVQKTFKYKVDKTAPTNINAKYETSSFRKFVNTITFGLFFKDTVTVTLTANDATSGVKELIVTIEGKEPFKVANGSTFTIEPQFVGNFSVAATDFAGNISDSVSFENFAVDMAAPTVPTATTADYIAGNWTSEDVTLTVSGSTADSGIAKYQYSTNGTTWIDMTTTEFTESTVSTPYNVTKTTMIVSNSNNIYKFRTVSNSGVNGIASEVISVKVDKLTPTFTINANGYNGLWTKEDVNFDFIGTSSNISQVTYMYSTDDGESWSNVPGTILIVSSDTNATYIYKAVSEADLVSDVTDGYVVKVQKTVPTKVDDKVVDITDINDIIIIPPVAPPEIIDPIILTVYYQLYTGDVAPEQTEFTGLNKPTITEDGIYTLNVWTEDQVGNKSDRYTTTIVYDTTAPTNITASYETSSFRKFVNTISFGLFFKDTVTVTLTADDATSGVEKLTVTIEGKPAFTVTNGSTFTIEPQFMGNFSVVATDISGNISVNVVFENLTVDNLAPTVPTATTADYTPGTWTSNDVTLNVSGSTADSGIAKYQYSMDGETWIDMTTTEFTEATVSTPYNATKTTMIVNSGNNIYKFRAVSNSGVNGIASEGISVKVDKLTPTFTINANGYNGLWTKEDVTFDFVGTSNNISQVTYMYSTDDGETWLDISGTTLKVSNDTNATYIFKAVSEPGLTSTVTDGYVVKVQKTVPTKVDNKVVDITDINDIIIIPPVAPPEIIDPIILTVYYQLYTGDIAPEQTEFTGSNKPTITEDGIYTLNVWTEDQAGNKSARYTTTIVRDTIAPANIDASYETSSFRKFVNTITFGLFFKDTVTVTLTADDATSGVKELIVTIEGKEPFTVLNGRTFKIEPQFVGNFSVVATDVSGNSSESTLFENFAVDMAAPTVPTSTTADYTAGNWTSDDVTLTVSGSTADSGIAKYQYSMDGETWIDMTTMEFTEATASAPYNATKTILIVSNAKNIYKFRAVSNSGVNGIASEGISVKVDKLTPTFTINANGYSGLWTKDDVTFDFIGTSSNISQVTYMYSTDDGETWSNVPGTTLIVSSDTNATYIFKAVSEVGLISDVTDGYVVKVQKTVPTKVDDKIVDITDINDIIIIPPVAPPEIIDPIILTVYYQLYTGDIAPEQTEFTGSNKPTITKDGIYTLNVWTEDQAGNKSARYTNTIVYDTTAPTNITASYETSSFRKFVNTITFGLFFKDTVTVTLTADDATSGVKELIVTIEGKEPFTVLNGRTFKIEPQFVGNFSVVATDVKENSSESVAFENLAVDILAPTVPTATTADFTAGNWTSNDVTFTVSGSTADSGIDKYQYSTDGETWIDMTTTEFTEATVSAPYNATKTILVVSNANNIYEFRTVSNSGVYGIVSEGISVKVDKLTPTFTINANGYNGLWTKENVNFDFIGTSSNISQVTYMYSTDDGETWSNVPGTTLIVSSDTNATYIFKAVSEPGLTSTVKDGYVVKVQKTLPTKVDNNVVDITDINDIIIIPPVAPPEIIDPIILTVYYQLYTGDIAPEQTEFTGSNKPTITEDGIYTLNVWTEDQVGNKSDRYTNTIVYDTTAPTNITASYETSSFKNFLNTITFGLFFKDTVTVTLTADDATSGVKELIVTIEGKEPLTVTNGSTFTVEPQFVGNFSVVATDITGNSSESTLFENFVVDMAAPTTPTVSTADYTPGNWTSNDVTLTVSGSTADSGITKYQYSTDGTNWSDMITTEFTEATVSAPYNATKAKLIVSSGNNIYKFRTFSNSGVYGTASQGVTVKIDKLTPTFTINANGYDGLWTKDDVTFDFVGTSNNILQVTYMYSTDDGITWSNVPGTKLIVSGDTNKTYIFKAVSEADLDSDVTDGYVVKVQKTVPTKVDNNVVDITDINDIIIIPPVAPPEIIDPIILTVYYQLYTGDIAPEQTEFTGSNKPTITEDGIYTLNVWTEDQVGNKSDIYTTNIVRDTIAPTNIIASYETSSFKNFLNTITFGLFFKDTVTVTLTADDATSGIKELIVTIEGKEPVIVTNGSTFTIEPQFVGNFSVVATDVTGNSSESTLFENFAVDMAAPTTPTVSTADYTPGNWTSNDVTLTVSGSTADSGITKYQYSTDGTNWSDMITTEFTEATVSAPYNATKAKLIVSSKNNIYKFRTFSNSGVYGTASQRVTVKIDKLTPTFTINANGYDGLWTKDDVTFDFVGTSNNILQVTYMYSTDDGITWSNVPGTKLIISGDTNKTYIFKAVSDSGLDSTITDRYVVKVQKTVPIKVGGEVVDISDITNIIIIPPVASPDVIDPIILTVYYQLYTGNVATVETRFTGNNKPTITEDGIYTLNVWTEDQAGNKGDIFTTTILQDTTAPTGMISVEDNDFRNFLNTISFNLFFKDTIAVNITGSDSLSGLQATEYYRSSTALSLEQVKALTSWTPYTTTIYETPVDSDSFIYYVKLIDKSGNVQYISSNGATFDMTKPTIEGITNGQTYYVDQTVIITDSNIDTITVNGKAFTSGSQITGDVDNTYIIVVTDKSGNSITYTVYTKTIDSINESIEGISLDNLKSSDKDDLDAVLADINAALGTTENGATDDEMEELNNIKDNIIKLLAQIKELSDSITVVDNDVKYITINNVKKEDHDTLKKAIDEYAEILNDYGKNLTDEEKDKIFDKINANQDILDSSEEVEAVKVVVDQIRNLPNAGNVTKDNAVDIENAKKAYDDLTDYQKTLVDSAIASKLNDVIETLVKSQNGDQPNTEDSTPIIPYAIVGTVALLLILVVSKKRRYNFIA